MLRATSTTALTTGRSMGRAGVSVSDAGRSSASFDERGGAAGSGETTEARGASTDGADVVSALSRAEAAVSLVRSGLRSDVDAGLVSGFFHDGRFEVGFAVGLSAPSAASDVSDLSGLPNRRGRSARSVLVGVVRVGPAAVAGLSPAEADEAFDVADEFAD